MHTQTELHQIRCTLFSRHPLLTYYSSEQGHCSRFLTPPILPQIYSSQANTPTLLKLLQLGFWWHLHSQTPHWSPSSCLFGQVSDFRGWWIPPVWTLASLWPRLLAPRASLDSSRWWFSMSQPLTFPVRAYSLADIMQSHGWSLIYIWILLVLSFYL